MLLGTINLLPGVRWTLLIGLWMSFIVLNCQVVEWVDIFANPVFKNPGIYYMSWWNSCSFWTPQNREKKHIARPEVRSPIKCIIMFGLFARQVQKF